MAKRQTGLSLLDQIATAATQAVRNLQPMAESHKEDVQRVGLLAGELAELKVGSEYIARDIGSLSQELLAASQSLVAFDQALEAKLTELGIAATRLREFENDPQVAYEALLAATDGLQAYPEWMSKDAEFTARVIGMANDKTLDEAIRVLGQARRRLLYDKLRGWVENVD